jgi:hypothetical protein
MTAHDDEATANTTSTTHNNNIEMRPPQKSFIASLNDVL